MMPEEWPIAASAAEQDAHARLAWRGRLTTVRCDFFLDPAKRLTEQERALITAMLHCLVGDIAGALRSALPNGSVAANDYCDAVLIGQLTASGVLDVPELIALLLRRADEERIATAARARRGRREARVLQGLVSHQHGAVASAAMALILGRGRRRDRFGQCLVTFDDLSAGCADVLVHAVAAGLRRELAATRGDAAADLELAQASEQLLDSRDEELGIDSLTAALVHFLDESGGLTDDLILAAVNEGEVAFVAEVLARRSGAPSDVALDELLSGDSVPVMALLRMASMTREVSAGLLAGIGDLLGIDDAAAAIDGFDAMSEAEVQAARSWLLSAPAYRAALERLGQGRG